MWEGLAIEISGETLTTLLNMLYYFYIISTMADGRERLAKGPSVRGQVCNDVIRRAWLWKVRCSTKTIQKKGYVRNEKGN
ncbi:hypothetical protein D3Z47_17330 [Lachnospiraceae bacterium]|nr:hypothetical protein [Lachnospiraceae bacterium]